MSTCVFLQPQKKKKKTKTKTKKPWIYGFPISHPFNSYTFFFTCYIAFILMLLPFTSSFVLLLRCRGQTKINDFFWIRIYPYALMLLCNFHFFLIFVRRFSCIIILHLNFFLFQLSLLLIQKKKKFFLLSSSSKEDWFPQSNQIKTA